MTNKPKIKVTNTAIKSFAELYNQCGDSFEVELPNGTTPKTLEEILPTILVESDRFISAPQEVTRFKFYERTVATVDVDGTTEKLTGDSRDESWTYFGQESVEDGQRYVTTVFGRKNRLFPENALVISKEPVQNQIYNCKAATYVFKDFDSAKNFLCDLLDLEKGGKFSIASGTYQRIDEHVYRENKMIVSSASIRLVESTKYFKKDVKIETIQKSGSFESSPTIGRMRLKKGQIILKLFEEDGLYLDPARISDLAEKYGTLKAASE